MSNIKIELGHPIIDGMPLSFRAPCNCNKVTGIKVEWQDGDDGYFIVFSFADAHGNDLTGLGNLFAAGAMVRVVLDIPNAKAFIQNADTNAYIEGTFIKTVNGTAPDKNGNVEVKGGATKEEVLAAIPSATSAAFKRSGTTITVTMPMDDGSTRTDVISLDTDGYPTSVTSEGATIPISWEGFE